ncbi:hypothetical protein VM1G_11712 [Cytospora mali]|uniref:Uncharacterized protein n=1 Tax=Cytospora mali TaxID=578113 RepID=A0A194W2X7_CYTMA|nr:hypothetical protein VM1G_11712 [Valsa mali]
MATAKSATASAAARPPLHAFVSAQSNPAPALANTLQLSGSRAMSSASHLPISPPVDQNGRKMALKSPHRRSFNAAINSGRWRSAALGRTTVKAEEKAA